MGDRGSADKRPHPDFGGSRGSRSSNHFLGVSAREDEEHAGPDECAPYDANTQRCVADEFAGDDIPELRKAVSPPGHFHVAVRQFSDYKYMFLEPLTIKLDYNLLGLKLILPWTDKADAVSEGRRNLRVTELATVGECYEYEGQEENKGMESCPPETHLPKVQAPEGVYSHNNPTCGECRQLRSRPHKLCRNHC